ncbi:MAG TPA: S8 family peptidase, partial [Thermoanaerobaculia bacterium]|nr:S8 family peptidase [Thermoanaerobaculia bacterium]
MRKDINYLARFFVVLLISGSAFAATVVPTAQSVPGEVLVMIQTGASSNDIASLEQSAGVDHGEQISKLKSGTIWRLHSASLPTDALTSALQRNPNIVYVEPNYILHLVDVPNDPSYPQLWGLKNTGQTISGSPGIAGADISAEAAWSVTTGSSTIVVGVVDTGVDYTHPDLAANIWSNPGGKGNVLCAAGTHGFNAITNTCDPRDDHYHGTHVSGTIGAVGNNALGVVGVNWTTSIMALKFLDASGSGTTAGAITAIDFAVQAKIDGVNVRILSNSWGGGGFSKALLDEINKANENDILFVAAAGNDAVSNDTSPHYPANYSTPNMISVAATDNRDALASFSDFGATSVHLGAPGVNVLSCYPGGSYIYLSGTSMATPHVAGVAALVLAKTPGLTTAQVKSAILTNTDPISSLSGKTITGGRLNAAKAVGAPLGPDFSLLVSPVTRNVGQGGSTTYTVTITPSNGFTGPVSLAVTGLPAGASGTFNP